MLNFPQDRGYLRWNVTHLMVICTSCSPANLSTCFGNGYLKTLPGILLSLSWKVWYCCVFAVILDRTNKGKKWREIVAGFLDRGPAVARQHTNNCKQTPDHRQPGFTESDLHTRGLFTYNVLEYVSAIMASKTLSSEIEKMIRHLCLNDFPCGNGSWVSFRWTVFMLLI